MRTLWIFPAVMALIIFLVAGCSKSNDNNGGSCNISTIIQYDGAPGLPSIIDNVVYSYTDGKVTKVDMSDWYLTFEYAGNKLAKRTIYEKGIATPFEYETLSFNPDGTLSEIQSFEKPFIL